MSDLTSFTNDSNSRDYNDLNYDGAQSSLADGPEIRNKNDCQNGTLSRMTDLMQRMFTNIEKHQDKFETKSEEICSLKVANAKLESVVDTKDEIIQQQALKIHDLCAEIKMLEEKNSTLEKNKTDLEKRLEHDNLVLRRNFIRRPRLKINLQRE